MKVCLTEETKRLMREDMDRNWYFTTLHAPKITSQRDAQRLREAHMKRRPTQ